MCFNLNIFFDTVTELDKKTGLLQSQDLGKLGKVRKNLKKRQKSRKKVRRSEKIRQNLKIHQTQVLSV